MEKQIYIIFLFTLLSLVGCNPGSEEVDESITPQIFVFPGVQEKRLISQETINLPNCTGNAELSQSVTRSHTFEYTVEFGSEITISADGRASIPGIGEVGVGAEIAANYEVGYGRSETISRSQTVAAAPGSHMQHTIQHFELWETGEVLIIVGDINQRLPYSFRRDFSIEAVAPANIGDCQGGGVSEPTVVDTESTNPSTTPTESTNYTDSGNLCFTSDWEACWSYDDVAKTMTWIGPTNNSFDIGQKGVALEKIKAGYRAILSLQTSGTIVICVGTVNGEEVAGSCPIQYELSSGNYEIVSPGPSGGFRVYK